MASRDEGAASAVPSPRSLYTMTTDPLGGSSLPITVELRDVRYPTPDVDPRGERHEVVGRAEVDVDWDGDTVTITVRRLEDDPTIKVELV